MRLKNSFAKVMVRDRELVSFFDPFQRTKSTEETIPGIGLGLSVARKLARAHGGDLTVFSELHIGSCFTLYIPVHGEKISTE